MAGSKKNKSKKSHPTQPAPIIDQESDDLVDDLVTQLDSRAPVAQLQSTTARSEALIANQVDQTEVNGKQSAKSRFKARQVRYNLCIPQIPLESWIVCR